MVLIKQAIEDLNQCILIEYDRLLPEQLEQEEQNPSAVSTSGEIIIYLKELQRLREQQKRVPVATEEQVTQGYGELIKTTSYKCPHCHRTFDWNQLGDTFQYCFSCGKPLDWTAYNTTKK